MFIILTLLRGPGGGNHINNTGSADYEGKDVTFNCIQTQEDTEKNRTVSAYDDLLVNYQGYSYFDYSKIEYDYHGITSIDDDTWCSFIHNVGGTSNQITTIDCPYRGQNSVNLGISTLGGTSGMNTMVTREGNKIILTYYKVRGMGQTLQGNQIRELKTSMEQAGFRCR